MARRPSLALLIIVAGSFFLIGLYTAFLQGTPAQPPSAQATIARPEITNPPTQVDRNILILGIDEIAAESPALKSIWLLSFRPPAPDIFLLGIPTNFEVQGDPPSKLSDQFSFRADSGPSSNFLDVLYRQVPLELDAIIVFDETGFARGIDFLGGVAINEATFTGQEVLGILSLSEDEPSANLQMQRRLLQAMSVQAAQIGASAEITPLVELIPNHLYISTSINQMVELLGPILPINPSNTHFELY